MAVDLTALKAELARDKTVNGSASTLITTLLAEIEANKTDPAEIQAIVDEFRANNDALAAAVAAGTPGQPPTDPPADPEARRS